jgi:hypothetical protein
VLSGVKRWALAPAPFYRSQKKKSLISILPVLSIGQAKAGLLDCAVPAKTKILDSQVHPTARSFFSCQARVYDSVPCPDPEVPQFNLSRHHSGKNAFPDSGA